MAFPTFSAGNRLTAAQLATLIPIANAESKDNPSANGTTTSSTYVNSLTTTGIRGVAFTACPSGGAKIDWSCSANNSVANSYTATSVEVRTGAVVGSGTVVLATNSDTETTFQSSAASAQGQHTGFANVTGLTAGASYNACITYKIITSGTGTFNRRRISVEPAG